MGPGGVPRRTMPLRPTLAGLEVMASQYDATVLVDGGSYVRASAWLPAGKVWRESGGHCISVGAHDELTERHYADLISRMSLGVCDCEDPDCEICELG